MPGKVSALPGKAGVVGRDDGVPGGAAHNSICRKAVGVLKHLHGNFGVLAEFPVHRQGGDVGVIHAQGVQVGLNARHFAAVRANGKQVPGVGRADS